jgi:hypothetical protein
MAVAGGRTELVKGQHVCPTMVDRHFEARGGSRHYSRWPYPWHPEDDCRPITAAIVFLIIVAGLIVYVSSVH